MKLILLLLAILIIILIIYPSRETFLTPQREINAACVYVCYNIDKLDYEFIDKYKDDIKFYVVDSVDDKTKNNEWSNKIKTLNNVEYIERENKGWDTTAWKETILNKYEELSKYDLVILANNSNVYDFDVKKICAHAIDYDMYGIKDATELYWHHLQSYFIIIHRHLFTTEDFKNYWINMKQINKRFEAIAHHELRFKPHFAKLGYKIGVYDITRRNPYFKIKPEFKSNYYPETIKKKVADEVYYENLKKNYNY